MTTRQRFVVTVDGIDHDVVIDTDASDVTRVAVDGVPVTVRAAPGETTLVGPPDAPGQRRVQLDPGPRPTQAHAEGRVFALTTRTHREAALDASEGLSGGAAGADSHVRAPMPGRVVRMLVAEGDRIETNAPLVIVEAMKMENEVRAHAAATVARVLVSAGDTVEAGQLMCELTVDAT